MVGQFGFGTKSPATLGMVGRVVVTWGFVSGDCAAGKICKGL